MGQKVANKFKKGQKRDHKLKNDLKLKTGQKVANLIVSQVSLQLALYHIVDMNEKAQVWPENLICWLYSLVFRNKTHKIVPKLGLMKSYEVS